MDDDSLLLLREEGTQNKRSPRSLVMVPPDPPTHPDCETPYQVPVQHTGVKMHATYHSDQNYKDHFDDMLIYKRSLYSGSEWYTIYSIR